MAQWPTGTAPATTVFGSEVNVAVGTGTTNAIRTGMFDDDYFSTGTGVLYVCGNNNSNTSTRLFGLAMTSGVLGTSTGLFNLGSSTGQCSPLTEIVNGATEWLFVGVPGTCAFGGSTTGCIMSFDITNPLTSTSTPVSTAVSAGGTSGIVVDNVSADGHASSLYYSTQGAATCTTETGGSSSAGGCAVQRTQSGLQ